MNEIYKGNILQIPLANFTFEKHVFYSNFHSNVFKINNLVVRDTKTKTSSTKKMFCEFYLLDHNYILPILIMLVD